jgi:hypothetical protein
MGKNITSFVSISILMVLMVACTATQPNTSPDGNLPGFWFGLWHGFIAPITFIISLFPNDLRIYAFPNTGLWYDFGFMLGISGFSGGIFAGSRRRGKG